MADNDSAKKVRCPHCKHPGPFFINQNLGALVCTACGIFFMSPDVRERLKRQTASKIISPGTPQGIEPFKT